MQKFIYGNMGKLTQKTHTFVMPQGGTYSFARNFDYDSWNRTRSITYADGEQVSYGYDDAGNLTTVSGQKGNQSSASEDEPERYFYYINDYQ